MRGRFHFHAGRITSYLLSGTPVLSATIGETASFTITASGGTPPYTYAVSSGALPTGQSINASTGAVTGTLGAAGTFASIILKATDANGIVAYLPVYTMVVASPSTYSITGSPTLTGTTGSAITPFTMSAVGATGAVTWSIDTAYPAPAGVVINSSTGQVTGTPTADGTFRVRVKGVDTLAVVAYSAVFTMAIQLAGATVVVPQVTQYVQYRVVAANSAVFSAHGKTFWQNASQNPDTEATQYYTGAGALTVQQYPVRAGSSNWNWRGGRFIGTTSMTVDVNIWTQQAGGYQNSACVFLDYTLASPYSQYVKIARIDHAWDGIRFASGTSETSKGLCANVVDQVWISNIQDDAIENDRLQTLLVTDSLFDGVHDFISCDAGSGASDHRSSDRITIDGCLVMLSARLDTSISATPLVFAPFKWRSDNSPSITMTNSIIAIPSAVDPSRIGRWTAGWGVMTDGGGNKLLYTGGDTMPSASIIGTPPAGFTQQTGATAIATWAAAKAAWIAAHPNVYRLDTD